MPVCAKLAGEFSWRVCEVGLRMECEVNAVGAVRGSAGCEAEVVVPVVPGFVGVSAMVLELVTGTL